MCVCGSSSFSEEHNFENCCYCPDGINLALKCSPKRCGCSRKGLGKVLQVCSVEQFFFIRFLVEYWKENDRNQLCCNLVCKEELSKGLVRCEVVTHSCSSRSTGLTQHGSALRALHGALCRPVCECVSSRQSHDNKRDLTALLHRPPVCIRPHGSREGESLIGAGAGGELAGYPELECVQGDKTIASTPFWSKRQ